MRGLLLAVFSLIFISARASSEVSVAASRFSITSQVPADGLVDNFDDGLDPNFWGGSYSSFASGAGAQTSSTYTSVLPFGGTGRSLQMDFNLANAGNFGGVAVNFNPARDLSAYRMLEFYVRGSVNNLSLKVELHNASANPIHNFASVYLRDYLDSGITTAWQRVRIPLDAFVNLDSVSNANQIVFTFERDYNAANSFPNSGSIFIDNLGFISDAVTSLRIDSFGDLWGTNALGGNVGAFNGGGSTHNLGFSASVFHNNVYASSSTYNVSPQFSFAGLFFIFGNGVNPVPHNFSAFSRLSLWVRSERVQAPNRLKLELVTPAGTYNATLPQDSTTPGAGLNQTWQNYILNLSAFKSSANPPVSINPNSIQQFNIVYENQQVGNAASQGTIFYDDIEFLP